MPRVGRSRVEEPRSCEEQTGLLDVSFVLHAHSVYARAGLRVACARARACVHVFGCVHGAAYVPLNTAARALSSAVCCPRLPKCLTAVSSESIVETAAPNALHRRTPASPARARGSIELLLRSAPSQRVRSTVRERLAVSKIKPNASPIAKRSLQSVAAHRLPICTHLLRKRLSAVRPLLQSALAVRFAGFWVAGLPSSINHVLLRRYSWYSALQVKNPNE